MNARINRMVPSRIFESVIMNFEGLLGVAFYIFERNYQYLGGAVLGTTQTRTPLFFFLAKVDVASKHGRHCRQISARNWYTREYLNQQRAVWKSFVAFSTSENSKCENCTLQLVHSAINLKRELRSAYLSYLLHKWTSPLTIDRMSAAVSRGGLDQL
ncbi:uncharacterized protein EDB91DRAFT_1127138 [Suillus paluster]|uniref:uncharacterized protein n=1 Tax=Suillus paluster TaxID=48578 RepID=UPI001B86F3CB|nr:uncharacterized protein EDB91DRAFT_1127138 [Suillus paluster]KAG1742628.1 hypothetical protein EDB91DRAFT_1127138 [Suillus paluster]